MNPIRKAEEITIVSLYYNNPNHSMIYFFDSVAKIGFRVHRYISKDTGVVSYSTAHKIIDCKDESMIKLFDDAWNEVGKRLESCEIKNMHICNVMLWNKYFLNR